MRNRFCYSLACALFAAAALRAETPTPPPPSQPFTIGFSTDALFAHTAPDANAPAPGPAAPVTGPGSIAISSECQAPALPSQEISCCRGEDDVFWIHGDYLLWAMRGSPTPPLITSAPAGSAAAAPGALGNPDTIILFGGRPANDGLRSGFRVGVGFWFGRLLDEAFDADDWGAEADFFYISPGHQAFTSPTNDPSVSTFRPFFNTATGQPGSEDINNLADGIAGQATARIDTQFCGGEANLRHVLWSTAGCGDAMRVDLLIGYRAQSLTDGLTVAEALTPLDLAGNPSGSLLLQDRFRTTNVFQGGQVGLDGLWRRENFFLDLRCLLAMGATHQTVDIEGVTVAQAPGAAPVTQAGGLYALPSNIGYYDRYHFTVVPTLGAALGYQLTPHLSASLGYDLIYWTSVVRAGDHLDTTVNPFYLPGPPDPTLSPSPARPAFQASGTDFWAQGLSFSLELRY